MLIATPGRMLLRDMALRFGLMMLFVVAGVFVARGVGVSPSVARPLVVGASVGFALARIHPAGTPNRWRKNMVSWGVNALGFAALSMLTEGWWGE